MKKTITIIMLIFSSILVNSCSKSETPDIINPGPSGNNGQGSVQWTFDGTSSSCDSSHALLGLKRIMAYKELSAVKAKTFILNLSSLSVGSYTLSATSPNVLTYLVATTLDHTSQSGTVNITANTGIKISGNFSALMENGLTLSGTFSEVPVRQ